MTKSRNILPPRYDWPPAAIELLTRQFADTPSAAIAAALGVTVSVVNGKAARLGLKKSADYLASPAACRLRRGDAIGAAHRFQSGSIPWNKGLNGNTYPGCVATQFKPGTRQGRALEIYQPIGAERLSKDGYRQRKINDAMPLKKRWRGVHILNWESVNGALPQGHALVFKDGNRQNCALDNLELIPRTDLMRRNSYHNYGPEIAQLIQLRGAVSRMINRRSKHA